MILEKGIMIILILKMQNKIKFEKHEDMLMANIIDIRRYLSYMHLIL